MNVSRFIAPQPGPSLGPMTILDAGLLRLSRHKAEKISNRIPCFSFCGPIWYLNTDDGAKPGLAKGFDRILESKGGKMLKSAAFYSLVSLSRQEQTIRHSLNEAAVPGEFRFKRRANQKK